MPCRGGRQERGERLRDGSHASSSALYVGEEFLGRPLWLLFIAFIYIFRALHIRGGITAGAAAATLFARVKSSAQRLEDATHEYCIRAGCGTEPQRGLCCCDVTPSFHL